MAYIAPAIRLTGDLVTAAIWNADIVANEIAINAGAIALTSQAIGDLIIASTTSQLSRVADVATGQVLVSGGVGVAPAYSGSPSLSGTLTVTGALAANGGITVDSTAFIVADTTGNMTCGTATTGLINGQTISSAASLTGTLSVGNKVTITAPRSGTPGTTALNIANDGSGALWGIRDGASDQFSLDYYSGSAWTNWLTVNTSGLLTVSGFGTHSFIGAGTGDQLLYVQNTTAGVGNYATIGVGNNNDGQALTLRAYSTTYTTSGVNIQASTLVRGNQTGGLSIAATNASGVIRFYSGGTTLRGTFLTTGDVLFGNISSIINSGFITASFDGASRYGVIIADNSNTTTCAFVGFYVNGALIGNITRVGATAAVVYNTTSDQRLKTDLGLASNIARLRDLPIHDFDWKSDGTTDRGVFAQEAHRLYPLAVSIGTDEVNDKGQLVKPWGVGYAAFVPDLIVGWQQHDARLAAMEAKLLAAGV